ncbi:MAG: hypothetical protein V3T70_02765 [Phycisphaerae bacterium]
MSRAIREIINQGSSPTLRALASQRKLTLAAASPGEQLIEAFIGVLGTAISGVIGSLTSSLFTLVFEPLLTALLSALGIAAPM